MDAEWNEREFLVLYIDVGMFHHNLDIIARYGNPIDEGIPSVVLLDPAGNTLFVSHGGLSSADSMSDAAIMVFFDQRTDFFRRHVGAADHRGEFLDDMRQSRQFTDLLDASTEINVS